MRNASQLILAFFVILVQLTGNASAADGGDSDDIPMVAPDLKGGAQSATLKSGTASTRLRTGTASTKLKTGTASTKLQTGTTSSLVKGQVEREAGPVNILFIIDASHSMKEGLGKGVQKIDAAKQVLQKAIARIPGDVNLGLRVFGQQFSNNPHIDCSSSALLVPMGQGNRRSIIEQVRQIRPFGLTPLTFALSQAERDLRAIEGRKHLILITDGAETCGGNPCLYIRRLNEIGIKIKVDIVGLGLKRDKDAKSQLNCIAEQSGGKFYDANTAAELIESVTRSVNKAISGKVITKTETPVKIKGIRTPIEMQTIEPLKDR